MPTPHKEPDIISPILRRFRAYCAAGAAALILAACTDSAAPSAPRLDDGRLVARIAIPPNYGIHDTFVRDGIAFVCVWNEGVYIYDVGNGIGGGTPAAPVRLSQIVTAGGNVHNAWWFHNPNTNERRYLFVGEEGGGSLFTSAVGDVHVVDVSDLTQPVEVASYHLDGAGAHNFWMDEMAGVLYAAFYNGGVVALDVSGTLDSDLATRELSRRTPGGPGNTFVWGVQLANGSLYAIDMLSGLWQLDPGATLPVLSGGNNVPERYSSDLWVHGDYAYSGTWGTRSVAGSSVQGNAVKVWALDGAGAPSLIDSIVIPSVRTVSDVEVSADGGLLMFSAENGTGEGIYWYDLSDPAHPVFIERALVPHGVHTATFGTIDGRLYAFGARNPSPPEWLIYDVTPLVP